MRPIFSFIVVNFRSAALLPAWFDSFSNTQLSPQDFEVIVVNNDLSECDTLEQLRKRHTFRLIQNTANQGFGKAVNKASKYASGEILGIINPDTLFLPGDFSLIQKQFQASKELGIIGLRLLTPDGSAQEWSAGSRVTLWDIIRNNFGFPKSKMLWESKHPISVDWVSGAALFIPRDTFQELNGFDEDFFLYFEDIDLCERIRQSSKTILYFPTLSVRHLSGQSSPSATEQKAHYYRSQDLYFQKHRPKWESFCISVLRKMLL